MLWAEGSELWIRGILVDGRFYSATQIFETGWIVEDTSIGWKQYERPNDFSNIAFRNLRDCSVWFSPRTPASNLTAGEASPTFPLWETKLRLIVTRQMMRAKGKLLFQKAQDLSRLHVLKKCSSLFGVG